MISGLYNTVFYQPLYNGLIFLMDIVPWIDAGVAVIVFTIIVKLILFPFSRKAVLTQQKIKKYDSELKAIKEKYKNKQEQAQQTLNFYKEKGINPFSSFFLILLQLPIIFALYKIFLSSGLPEIKGDILYSFVAVPQNVDMVFLGLIDISLKSWVLAILVGVTSFAQMRISMPKLDLTEKSRSFKQDLARSMSIQMRYVFPLIALFISYSLSGAIALYWLTSNVFTIGQELFLKRSPKEANVDAKKIPKNPTTGQRVLDVNSTES